MMILQQLDEAYYHFERLGLNPIIFPQDLFQIQYPRHFLFSILPSFEDVSPFLCNSDSNIILTLDR